MVRAIPTSEVAMVLARVAVGPALLALVSALACSPGGDAAIASAVTTTAPTPPRVLPGNDPHFWIGDVGPTGPLFSGPQQYPFICTTVENGLGQPLVDNHDGIGNAVFPSKADGEPDFAAAPIGWSRTCSIPTRVDYFYFGTDQSYHALADPTAPPADVERITVNGRNVPYVVRLERGTINRFIYSIAMLAPFAERLDNPARLDKRAWNGKLVYSFQGGVAIGHQQGFMDLLGRTDTMHEQALRRGYAVAYSTRNLTDTHYNLVLAGETALMVKHHFMVTYGQPGYTVGVGGSGGAIQQ